MADDEFLVQRRTRHSPPELWFRGQSHDGIRDRSVTATVRLGDRTETHAKGYAVGERVLLRCLDADNTERLAVWAWVREVRVLACGALESADLAGCAPSERTPELLRSYLPQCYGRPIAPDELVTTIRFSYEREQSV